MSLMSGLLRSYRNWRLRRNLGYSRSRFAELNRKFAAGLSILENTGVPARQFIAALGKSLGPK